jgi:hypothetical protein
MPILHFLVGSVSALRQDICQGCQPKMAAAACVNHPAIQAGSLPVSQVANLPGYYKIPNITRDPLLIAHNFSYVLSTLTTTNNFNLTINSNYNSVVL